MRATNGTSSVIALALLAASCAGSSNSGLADDQAVIEATTTTVAEPSTPGGFDFARSDPEAGVANLMDAFATDRTTAVCIFTAWGDVASVAPEELTADLMTFPICGTSIFQMITGDPRFTGQEGG